MLQTWTKADKTDVVNTLNRSTGHTKPGWLKDIKRFMVINKYSSDVQDAVDNKTKIMKEVHNSNINQKVFACFLEDCPGQGQQQLVSVILDIKIPV